MVIAALVAATAIWFPVPFIIDAIVRANITTRLRWLLLGMCSATVVVLEPLWFSASIARFRQPPPGGFIVNAALRLDTNLLILGATAGWLWLCEVQRRREATERRSSELRSRASNAELDVLTLQLQPHFLFNTLNLVSQLAYESATRARRAIANLRRLIAESVGGATSTIALGDELRLLESYLDLQRDRFGHRLEAHVTAERDALAAQVPRMLLQPIVENAIRHGIAPRRSGGRVEVRVSRKGSIVAIEVADDGVGLRRPSPREGMGLANARHRLEQLHASHVRVEVTDREQGGAVTNLEFPFDARARDAGSSDPSDASDASDAFADDVAVLSPAVDARLRTAIVICGWAAIGAIWTELETISPMMAGLPVRWSEIFARDMLNAGVWMVLTPIALWLIDRLSSQTPARRAIAHMGGAVAFTAAHLSVAGVLMGRLLNVPASAVRDVRFGWAIWDVIAYATLVAIAETIATRARLREESMEAARAKARLDAARVSLLRLHLQPSILLSSLDAIDAAIGDPARCETALTRLGDVLRLLLINAACEESTLIDELALLDGYLAVIGRRASSNPPGMQSLDATIPTALLCSIAAALDGSVDVVIERRGSDLVIEIDSDGTALDAELLSISQRRLALLFAGERAMEIAHRDGSIVIELRLPFHAADTARYDSALDERAIA